MKILESENVKIDFITGTSMGANFVIGVDVGSRLLKADKLNSLYASITAALAIN